ncbi:MAG: PspC domain-containing protein [Candidatus Diapherotrites archaeon]|nr:PspC domain-containing protein [Candidatus Diapherotrites archaeon]
MFNDSVAESKTEPKRFYRSKERILGGVCGGLAKYFNVDPVLVRVGWVALTLLSMGLGLLLYLVLWLVAPEEK